MANNFTRPNDTNAYTSGDLVANNTTAGSVVPLSYPMGTKDTLIRRVRINKTSTGVTGASFRVHFYTASPTCANGDNGAWSTSMSGYLGFMDATVDKVFTNGASGQGATTSGLGTEIIFPEASGQAAPILYALVEARGAYAPGAQEVITVLLETMGS